MRRFVYAPKVEIFIRLEDEKRVIDVSDDVISGSVSRRLNKMSTAEFKLQNKRGKYSMRIKPMDRIIIRLGRVGTPTLVFSGYVDEGPYYQMYPAPVTIKASDTLKLLQHTYFDPGLPFTQYFFESLGWQYNPQTGLVTDLRGGTFGNYDVSGGVGELLFTTLVVIGGWNPDHIHIKKIPNEFLKSIRRSMIKAGQEERDDIRRTVERLRKLLTVEGLEQVTGIPGAGNFKGGNIPPEKAAQILYDAGFRGNDHVTILAIAMAESGLKSDAVSATNDYGLLQVNHTWIGKTVNGVHIKSKETLFDPVVNARVGYGIFKSGGFNQWCTWKSTACGGNGNNSYENYLGEAQTAIKNMKGSSGGSFSSPDTIDAASAAGHKKPVQAPVYPLAIRGTRGSTPADHRARALGNWESDNAWDISVPIGTPVIAVDKGQITKVYRSTSDISSIRAGWQIHFKTANNEYFYTHLKGLASGISAGRRLEAGQLIGYTGAANNVPHLHFAARSGLYSNTEADWWFNRPIYVDGSIVVPGGDFQQSDPYQLSQEDMANMAAAIGRQTAFFTQQLQSSDTQLSLNLIGKRALANDISLMEWITELVPSSGRVFTTHPNGDFYSFFPDYFGYFNRTPYFYLSDIEIRDLTIQVSDQDLTTHVFASGPVINTQAGITIGDQAASMIASVQEEAFDMFINVNPSDTRKPRAGKKFSPNAFLERYGARPLPLPLPNVNHPMLLWMAAWTKFTEQWAKQFPASGEFTFMPELFPGGLVAFGNRISMFVEEVTHTFDREGGFSTSASLSAPAAINKKFDQMALAGAMREDQRFVSNENIPYD